MEQTNLPILRNLPLQRLVTDALGELERLGYSRRSRNRYRAIWDHLSEFSDGKELGDEFSGELAVRFLEEYGVRDEEMDKPGDGWRRHMVWGVKVLADFARNGRIEPFGTPHSRDPTSGEGDAVYNHCGDLGTYQFGINTNLREGGCRGLAERGVGS